MIIGAGLSLGEALIRTGVTEWLAEILTPLLFGHHILITLAILVFMSAILTNVMNNTTIAAVFVPVLISISYAAGINPLRLVMPCVIATTFGYSLPSASARMALVYSTGIVKREEMMTHGFNLMIPSAIAIILLFYLMILVGVM